MKKRTKQIVALLAASAMILGMTACGDGSSSSASANAAGSSSAGTASEDKSAKAESKSADSEAKSTSAEDKSTAATEGEGMTYVEVPQEKLDMIQSGNIDVDAILTYDTSGYSFDPSELKVAVSLGYYREDSGQTCQKAYEETLAGLGITDVTYTQTEYDPVEQAEQINTLIAQEPDILYVLASDPNGITDALQNAMDAGIPTFVAERVNGVDVTQNVTLDDYSAGYASMKALCEELGGEGKIAMCLLDSNAVWNVRDIAAYDVLEDYPGVEVIATWSWDSTGVVTPRQAIDNFLTQFPEAGSLDAIWAPWDNACLEGLPASEEAGRTEVQFCSSDGTPKAVELLCTSDQYVFLYAHCLYDVCRTSVLNGMAYLDGVKVNPKWCYTGMCLEKDKMMEAYKNLPDGVAISDYDRLYMYEAWGIERAEHFDYDYDNL